MHALLIERLLLAGASLLGVLALNASNAHDAGALLLLAAGTLLAYIGVASDDEREAP